MNILVIESSRNQLPKEKKKDSPNLNVIWVIYQKEYE